MSFNLNAIGILFLVTFKLIELFPHFTIKYKYWEINTILKDCTFPVLLEKEPLSSTKI